MKDIKKVAVLYSGGKDSNYAVQMCKERGWQVAYLLSVKPSRKDCYLFHYATVEHTPLQAQALGLKHILVECDVADPVAEAEIVMKVVEQHPVDAVVLGGTGLQVTQIKAVQKALLPLGVEVFPSHGGHDHNDLLLDMIHKGYKIMITQIASDGLGREWVGKILTKWNLDEFFLRSLCYGFPAGGDGGYYETFVLDMPYFTRKIEVPALTIHMESPLIGYVVFDRAVLGEKLLLEKNENI